MKNLMLSAALPVAVVLTASPASADSLRVPPPKVIAIPVGNAQKAKGVPGAVTSADPRATEAGREILRAGGTATDAALAMMIALTVVEPQSSGIGGGGFLVHYDAKTGTTSTVDGREKAPASARPDRFTRADGRPMPFLEAVVGGRSVGVPGALRLAALAHRKWGRLPWARLFQPAIRLAEGGFTATRALAGASATTAPLWLGGRITDQRLAAGDGAANGGAGTLTLPQIAAQYAPGGKPIVEGQRVTNPALAKTLRAIAVGGPDAFYRGPNARALLAQVDGKLAPGGMTAADLAGYDAKERPAVCAPYRQWRLCGMGPPSAGATTVFQILGMLERFDLKAMGKDSPAAWNLIAEAMRLAYADRELYLGDPDFVQVPMAGLLDRHYLAGRSLLIAPDKVLGHYEAGTPPGAQPRTASNVNDRGTTHFIAVDRSGDVVTYTNTVEGVFGSQLIANGYILNNQLTDFAFVPSKDGAPVANRVEPGKRPLSSMAPTIVYGADGKPVFAVGAAGGRTIPMQVVKALIAHLDWGLPARDALGLGLIYYDQDGLILEQGTSAEALKAPLERLGQNVRIGKLGLKANAAEKTQTGWVGAADPRSVGTWLGE